MSNLKKGYVNVRLEPSKDNIVVLNAIYIHYKNNNEFQILLIKFIVYLYLIYRLLDLSMDVLMIFH